MFELAEWVRLKDRWVVFNDGANGEAKGRQIDCQLVRKSGEEVPGIAATVGRILSLVTRIVLPLEEERSGDRFGMGIGYGLHDSRLAHANEAMEPEDTVLRRIALDPGIDFGKDGYTSAFQTLRVGVTFSGCSHCG